MLLEMEDFGEIPVEVQLNIDSPQMTDEPENTGAPSDIKPSLQAATRKTRRSRRSKLASQKSEYVKMECNLCSFETNEGRNALQSHFLDDHSKEDLASTLISITYPDALEDSANESPDSIRSATKRSASLHACPVCQKNIAGKNNLEKHLIRHSSQKPFKCDECKKMFSAKRDLQLHEMRHHSKERPHVCPTCNKGFVDKAYLKKHMTFHDQSKFYVCETCGKSFNNVLGLAKHCKTHSQERPYMCEKCSKCFRVKYDLTVHKRNVHKEAQIQQNEPDSSTV
ncbi:histone-lysine N-methyltransferase PRDM9-like [Daphnia pulex]|uniref:histone-lysine N-methyltransferase PRDM9-like n=1 Tax=Daphnia pulex TaxID=6669 RepID=UPI001EDFA3F4|nr:histone-lysine N-methyltransferase PRDM9-like [Daphnia pulex]